MAADDVFKKRKIAIPQKPFDRSLLNLAR